MTELAWASAGAIAAAVAGGEISATEVIDQALARIAQRNASTECVHRGHRRACACPRGGIDAARAVGKSLGPLAGVPFAVKNLIDIVGLPTLAGSKINRAHPPATADATLVRRLEAAGAVLVGALNMGEYAYDFTGENSHDGASRNPHDTARMTGGSSGGSGRRGRRRLGADRARLRHQRLDPRAVVVLRHLRTEADIWPTVPRRQFSVRVEPRPSRSIRAQRDAIWRSRMMP